MEVEEAEEMTAVELLKVVVEENTTRKILEIVEKSSDLEEAKKKIRELLEK